jgi:hypothetical protein
MFNGPSKTAAYKRNRILGHPMNGIVPICTLSSTLTPCRERNEHICRTEKKEMGKKRYSFRRENPEVFGSNPQKSISWIAKSNDPGQAMTK